VCDVTVLQAGVGFEIDLEKQVVPVTLGPYPKPAEESCVVILFKPLPAKKMLAAVRRAAALKPDSLVKVVQTKEAVAVNGDDANRIFDGDANKAYAEAAVKSGVIGVEFNGEGAIAACRAAAATIGNGLVFISTDAEEGEKIVKAYFTYVDMQLKI
jgi:hypothetical protein